MGLGIVVKDNPKKEVTRDDIYEWFSRVTNNGKKKFVITDDALELVNKTMNAPEYDGLKFVDALTAYQEAMTGSGISFKKYLDAVRFCGFLESTGGDAVEAYKRTFPDSNVVKSAAGKSSDTQEYTNLHASASIYRKGKIVIKILAESEVPLYLMLQGYRYKAVQVLADKMMNAKYDRDRINAADKLLLHLKPPEDIKIDLDIGLKSETVIDQYKTAISMLADEQMKHIKNGGDIKSIINAKIIDVNALPVDKTPSAEVVSDV